MNSDVCRFWHEAVKKPPPLCGRCRGVKSGADIGADLSAFRWHRHATIAPEVFRAKAAINRGDDGRSAVTRAHVIKIMFDLPQVPVDLIR